MEKQSGLHMKKYERRFFCKTVSERYQVLTLDSIKVFNSITIDDFYQDGLMSTVCCLNAFLFKHNHIRYQI